MNFSLDRTILVSTAVMNMRWKRRNLRSDAYRENWSPRLNPRYKGFSNEAKDISGLWLSLYAYGKYYTSIQSAHLEKIVSIRVEKDNVILLESQSFTQRSQVQNGGHNRDNGDKVDRECQNRLLCAWAGSKRKTSSITPTGLLPGNSLS